MKKQLAEYRYLCQCEYPYLYEVITTKDLRMKIKELKKILGCVCKDGECWICRKIKAWAGDMLIEK